MTPRIDQLISLLEESPSDSFVLFALAKEYQNINENEKAKHYYEVLLSSDENYVGAYYHLGGLLADEGLEDQALEVYSKGINIATAIKDLHSLAELKSAKLNLELGL
jgi:tetratricopeptide (TPR) repeat protein